MRSRNDFLQEIVRKYQNAGNAWPTSPKEIARWAIANKHWMPQPEAIINQCAEQLSRAMAAEYFTDEQGRRVRAKHAVVFPEGQKQLVLWDDIRTAEPKHIEIALQQRRHHILYECKQLKNDVDHYNENRNPPRPIQMVFDFTLDLEEMELARKKRAA
ncbi:MAG: hypothetical protein ACREBC_38055 [Pyrinomonadaceae bacterium]